TSVSLRAWKEFMVQAIDHLALEPTQFSRPEGVVSREVCWPSGKLPTSACPAIKRYSSLYAAEVLPGGPEGLGEEELARMYDTWWQEVSVDRRTGLRASDNTPAQFVTKDLRLVLPEDEVKKWSGVFAWASANGVGGMMGGSTTSVAAADLPARIDSPSANAPVSGNVTITGRATSENFQQYRLEWGRGESPNAWVRISSSTNAVTGGALGQWDTANLTAGVYTLRIVVEDENLGSRYFQIPVRVQGGDGTTVPS